MRMEIVVPDSLMPKPQPYRNCECMKQPIDLKTKKGVLTWLCQVGDTVEKGQVICEGEADKKTVEITAPADGVLSEKVVEDELVFQAGDILGYIEG
ncbi:lipoyl domain-containing protein [Ihubacter sp. mB4P-1]|uniref:lipoyl domain-containing protein n=1 Tax=Ihubacter sp. mB4P-1 TaxID=3242370 RepID=UPI0013797B39